MRYAMQYGTANKMSKQDMMRGAILLFILHGLMMRPCMILNADNDTKKHRATG